MTDLLGRPVEGDIVYSNRTTAEQYDAEEFLRRLDAIFDADPEVKYVFWTQYTPYFNDGEPCVFSVGDVSVIRGGDRPYYFDYDEAEWDDDVEAGEVLNLWSLRPKGDWVGTWPDRKFVEHPNQEIDPVYEPLKNLGMNHFENVCLEAFGDHATVIATREGFEVEFYEHD